MICISVCSFTEREKVFWLSRELKKIKDIKILIGGHDPSFTYRDYLNTGNIDIVTIGEGEITLPKVISRIEKCESYHTAISRNS